METNSTLEAVLIYIGMAYLVLVFIKFALMASSAHVSAGVHLRYLSRRGMHVSPTHLYVTIVVGSFFACLFGVLGSLKREGMSFFITYPKRQVIRESLATCEYFASLNDD